jgi:hypothetical protein
VDNIFIIIHDADSDHAGILEQSMGAKNRVEIGLPYRPAKLQRLAESIPGLHKSLKIPPQIHVLN